MYEKCHLLPQTQLLEYIRDQILNQYPLILKDFNVKEFCKYIHKHSPSPLLSSLSPLGFLTNLALKSSTKWNNSIKHESLYVMKGKRLKLNFSASYWFVL
jgi:hypothetical protein